MTEFSATAHSLRYQRMSRHWIYASALAVLAFTLFALGAPATARSAVDFFGSEQRSLAKVGITLENSLNRPIREEVSSDGNGGEFRTGDNPLRTAYETAGQAVTNTKPVQSTINALEALCFALFPVLFFAYGVITATRDTRLGTLKVNAVRYGPRQLFLSGLTAVTASVTLVVTVSAGLGLLVATGVWLGNPVDLGGHPDLVPPPQAGVGQLLVTMAVTIGVGAFFGILGVALGTIFRQALVIIPAFLVAFFLVPLTWRFDPRNLLMTAVRDFLDFKGTFIPSPSLGVSQVLALVVVLGIGAAAVAAGSQVATRRSLYR
ncbi:hypothetical protein ACFTWS_19005 [Streptomyces sp. NPDC057027]|uniref:hypothetical protein n=1 Tax=Streptomyces sp. NPDC057027 TaxID=3346004 RepID=UPI003635A754